MYIDLTKHLAFRKVPEITAIFWMIKLSTTALGESTSDFLVFAINPYLAVFLGGILLLIALFIQFKVQKYIPWVYWLTVTMVAIFGTMAADSIHKQLGVPYIISSIVFLTTLILILMAWHKTEKTLSIHSINTRRREIFYWATVLATFALGTAAGDLTAITVGLGYFGSTILFIILIIVPAIGYWKFKLNKVIAFWLAYIITRPIGASLADWFGKSKNVSGLGWGDGHASLYLASLLIILIIYISVNHQEIRRENSN